MTKFEITKGLVGLSLIILCGTAYPVYANADSPSIVESLENSGVFAPGIRVTVKVSKDVAIISTYRNSKANDSDCKIEAVLAAKTIFDLNPDQFVRVTVYFFESTLSTYKQVSVSVSDVKAFGSGEISKEKLIASIQLKNGEMDNVGKRVSSYLEASKTSTGRRKIQTKIKGQDVEVLVAIDSWVSDSELKLESMRLAREALKAAQGYKRVYITFADPLGETPDRTIKYEETELLALSNRLKEVTDSISIESGQSQWLPSERSSDDPSELVRIRALPGIVHDDRKKLLERIKELAKLGVGVKPFLAIFFELEDTAARGDEDAARKMMDRLSASLADQESRQQNAKNFKPKGDGTKTTSQSTSTDSKKTEVDVGDASGMETPSMKAKILANPKGSVDYWRMRYRKGSHGPHDFPNFARLLKTVVKVLNENNRSSEATAFQTELDSIKTEHPDWKF